MDNLVDWSSLDPFQQANVLAQQNNAWSAKQAQNQMDFQERMSNTAHQREIADLKAAGLNPVLSAKLGGASTPNGAMGSTDTSNVGALVDLLQLSMETANSAAGAAYASASSSSGWQLPKVLGGKLDLAFLLKMGYEFYRLNKDKIDKRVEEVASSAKDVFSKKEDEDKKTKEEGESSVVSVEPSAAAETIAILGGLGSLIPAMPGLIPIFAAAGGGGINKKMEK